MWELYDELINGIDSSMVVDDFVVGSAWSMVRSAYNTGVALTVKQRAHNSIVRGNIIGDKLRDIAYGVKSWNFIEASLGMAAINCFYNTPQKITLLNGHENVGQAAQNNDERDAFNALSSAAVGKNVAVIGRFPHLESQLAAICQLSVLERNPDQGDYPDSACEYILHEQDMVFITGMTLTNKTLPRLLQLTKPDARVVMVGPSVPMSPLLFQYGITDLDGFCVTDHKRADWLIRRGEKTDIFQCGSKVILNKALTTQL